MNETEKMQLWADYRKSAQLLKKEGVNARLLIAAIEFIYGMVRTKIDENEKFEVAYKFGFLAEYLLRAGISVEVLQEGIRNIAEAIE